MLSRQDQVFQHPLKGHETSGPLPLSSIKNPRRESVTKRARLHSLMKRPRREGFVIGQDFSCADNGNRTNGALAPEVCFLPILSKFGESFRKLPAQHATMHFLRTAACTNGHLEFTKYPSDDGTVRQVRSYSSVLRWRYCVQMRAPMSIRGRIDGLNGTRSVSLSQTFHLRCRRRLRVDIVEGGLLLNNGTGYSRRGLAG
jgi:hypothetical protein